MIYKRFREFLSAIFLKPIVIVLIFNILLCFSSLAQSSDEKGKYLIMGLGNLSCDAFLSEDEKGQAFYLSWLAGYMTAYNRTQANTYSILGGKNVVQIESWLKDYCTVNSRETFESAANKLMKNLKHFRIKSGS